jgi:hypothetical protein
MSENQAGADPFDFTQIRIPVYTGTRIPGGRGQESGIMSFSSDTKKNALALFQNGYNTGDRTAMFVVGEMTKYGLVRPGASFLELNSAYDAALKLTAQMSAPGAGYKNKISVLDAIRLMGGTESPGGPAGPGGTYKDFIKYTKEQVNTLANSTYQQVLGRVPTEAEVRAFGKAIAAGAKATPQVRKVSSTGKVTVTQKGFDEGAFIAGYMSDKIPDAGSDLDGIAGNIQDLIDSYTENYGVSPTQSFINNAIKTIVRQGGTGGAQEAISDLEQQLKEQAQVLYPALKEKINAGMSVRAIADPYISRTAKLLEKSELNVGLKDKYVSAALSRKNDKGEYELMSTDEHAKSIRSSDEWLNTKNAKETFLSAADSILQTFGFIGK